MEFSCKVAPSIHSQCYLRHEGRLLQSFKLKSKKLVTYCNLISDQTMNKICKSSSQSLEELVIRSCHKLSTSGLLNSLLSLRNLKHLDLGYAKNIDDNLILGIAENDALTSSLEKLNLRLLKALSSSSVSKIVIRCYRLTALDISGCVRLSGSGLFCVLSETGLQKLLLDFLNTSS